MSWTIGAVVLHKRTLPQFLSLRQQLLRSSLRCLQRLEHLLLGQLEQRLPITGNLSDHLAYGIPSCLFGMQLLTEEQPLL